MLHDPVWIVAWPLAQSVIASSGRMKESFMLTCKWECFELVGMIITYGDLNYKAPYHFIEQVVYRILKLFWIHRVLTNYLL